MTEPTAAPPPGGRGASLPGGDHRSEQAMGLTDDRSAPPAPEDRSLAAYLAEVASGEPTPGGGSVVAVVAALAAALGAMVAHLSLGRADAETGAETELRDHLATLDALRGRLLPLAAADEAAYGAYRAAAAWPRTDDAARASRTAALRTALLASTEVPLAVAAAAVELARALAPVARLGNRHALADVTIAAWLNETALRGALLNVRGNVGLFRDGERGAHFLREADRLETEGTAAVGRVLAAVAGRE